MTDEQSRNVADLRASDADRERVAEVLRDALAEGRLDMAEFEERLEATYKARTYGELAPITRDLPGRAGVRAAGRLVAEGAGATGRGLGGPDRGRRRLVVVGRGRDVRASSARAAGPFPGASTASPSGAAARSTCARRTSPTARSRSTASRSWAACRSIVPPGVEVVVRGHRDHGRLRPGARAGSRGTRARRG